MSVNIFDVEFDECLVIVYIYGCEQHEVYGPVQMTLSTGMSCQLVTTTSESVGN